MRRLDLDRLLLTALLLTPAFLLHSFVMTLRATEGGRSITTLIAALLVYAVPVTSAGFMMRGTPHDVHFRLTGVCLAAASIAGTLGALEILVRVTSMDPAAHPVWRRAVGDSPYYHPPNRKPMALITPRARWGHQFSSNERGYFGPDNTVHYEVNSAGFRGGDFMKSKPEGVFRIALVGDSFGFGEGVKEPDTAARRIERIIRERTRCNVEVDNFSVPGYDSVDEADLIESTVMDYRPDLVVIWFFLNDAQATGTMSYLAENNPAVFFPVLRLFSGLARFVGVRLDARFFSARLIRDYHRVYQDDSERFVRMKASLKRIADAGHRAGVPVVLFIHPILFELDARYPFADIHLKVSEIGSEIEVPVFDLFEPFRGRNAESLWVHPSDQHPNEVAHRIAGDYAAAKLEPLLPSCR
jgi:hypothetical protein